MALSLEQLRPILSEVRIDSDPPGFSTDGEQRSVVNSLIRLLRSEKGVRLSECLRHLSTALEARGQALSDKKQRTAAIKIILDGLSRHEDAVFQPPADDYIKLLKTTLSFPPNVEHLSTEQWAELAKLCQDSLEKYCKALREPFSDELSVRNESSRSFTNVSGSGTPGSSSRSASVARKPNATGSRFIVDTATVDNLLSSLSQLFAVPHAPILEGAHETLDVLFDVLSLTANTSRVEGHCAAFTCITLVFQAALTEDVELCLFIIRRAVPHIRRLFPAKTNQVLREQMLIITIYAETFWHRIVTDSSDQDMLNELLRLAEALKIEYLSRAERALLKIEDIAFGSTNQSTPLAYRTLTFRGGDGRVEQAWALLRTVTLLMDLSHTQANSANSGEAVERDSGLPKKRRRLEQTSMLRAFIETVAISEGKELLSNLHLLTFVVLESSLKPGDSRTILEATIPLVSNDSPELASWAMIIVACLACRKDLASQSGLDALWLRTWQLGARMVPKVATSRAASHMMGVLIDAGLIVYHDMSDNIDSMFSSIDLNGPAQFADSSVHLWLSMVHLRATHRPAMVQETSKRILQWLIARWKPAETLQRVGDPQTSASFNINHFIALFATILGQSYSNRSSANSGGSGVIAQACIKYLRARPLTQYLVNSKIGINSDRHASNHHRASHVSRAHQQELHSLAIGFLQEEINSVLGSETFAPQKGTHKISPLAVQSLSALSVLSFSLTSTLDSPSAHRLQQSASRLARNLRNSIRYQDLPLDLRDVIVSTIAALLPKVATGQQELDLGSRGAIIMSHEIGSAFWASSQTLERPNSEDVDLMDLESDFNSQRSVQRSQSTESSRPRDWLGCEVDPWAVKLCSLWRVHLFSLAFNDVGTALPPLEAIPPDFSAALSALNCHDFIACRPLVLELLDCDAGLDPSFAATVLSYLGDNLLGQELGRSEAGLSTAIEMLTSSTRLWPHAEAPLANLSKQLYRWFITAPLQRNKSSPYVLVGIAKMLRRVIEVAPNFLKDDSLPSARTCLFTILGDGSAAVKFAVGSQIPKIFSRFLLKDHDRILNDILESLPVDPSWPEGAAVRLDIFARLGAAWSTLIRKCMFAIVEAPILMPMCSGHAKACLQYLSTRLGLESSRTLFQLFVSQILYTWLSTQSLGSIPYDIFDYQSLPMLLENVRSEVTAQVVMRGRESEANELSALLKKPYIKILEESFGKCAAYCIARDAAVDPKVDETASGAAVRLRKFVGKAKYTQLLTERFPEVLATLFISLDREDSIVKSFQKYEIYAAAQSAFEEIVSSGSSPGQLTVSQQPSFKSTCLLDEIDYICGRTDYDAESMWNPALYTFVYREIVRTIHPALGELHACSAIRRLRILISMAGDVALSGYPLEMALHCLQSHLTLTQCAEDVMSIFRFLLTRGSTSLQEDPGFVAGILTSTLATLKSFLETPQDSTTQESDFRSMISKAQEFHAWISSFAREYHSPRLNPDGDACFKKITAAATHLRGTGTASLGTSESELLLAILDDQRSDQSLINKPARAHILSQLCSKFTLAPSYREDILGNLGASSAYASVVWESFLNESKNKDLALWVGRVLGRAYAEGGYIDPRLVRETEEEYTRSRPSPSLEYPMANSRSAILQRLNDILFDDDQLHVGLAEEAIRMVVNAAELDSVLKYSVDELPQTLAAAFVWKPFQPQEQIRNVTNSQKKLPSLQDVDFESSGEAWIRRLCMFLLSNCQSDAILACLLPIVSGIEGIAWQLFPCILHLALLTDHDQEKIKKAVSKHLNDVFQHPHAAKSPVAKRLINAVLYLRSQPKPREATQADRCHWLEVDFRMAAEVAIACNMFKTALLFLEINFGEQMISKKFRRWSGFTYDLPTELLLRIYQKLDDKDWFYGLQQPASLPAVMTKLQFENSSFKRLSFQSAYLDSQLRYLETANRASEANMVDVLNDLELNGLAMAVFSNLNDPESRVSDVTFQTARRLEQWDFSSQSDIPSRSTTIFKAFQGFHDRSEPIIIKSLLDSGFESTLRALVQGAQGLNETHKTLETLAVLSEIEDVLSVRNASQLQDILSHLETRGEWMLAQRYVQTEGRSLTADEDRPEFVTTIDSSRRTLFSTLSKNTHLQAMMKISAKEAREAEVHTLLSSSALNRHHGALQGSLSSAMYLTQLINPCINLGLNFEVAVQSEASNVLWDQGELSSSIHMLQEISHTADFKSQSIPLGRAEVLGKLAHRISEARREKPEEIMRNYLTPAISELEGKTQGLEAGQVFHQFAVFCDQQLQNPDILEDFRRVETLRQRKEEEVHDLKRMIESNDTPRRDIDQLKIMKMKAQRWLDLDNHEFRKLKENRTALLCQSLENYLLCLQACDAFDNDALRFSALWLEHYEETAANAAVSKQIGRVASRKFASLMNQWTSRLLDNQSDFQKLLADLVARICIDHPYHGMYHIFTSSKSKSAKDPTARSRQDAAGKVIGKLKQNKPSALVWLAIHNSNVYYVRFAMEPIEESRSKNGPRIPLRKSPSGLKLMQDVQVNRVPPPTMSIPLRPSCDYTDVPFIQSYHAEFTVASGISAPKILTAVTSDGRKHRQLFKSGNDDLRQDAIMEQVFEQVNSLLRSHPQTRQRNLGIRTYKVLPLTTQSGIIEFVPNTCALHDYLMPAHHAYFPNDLRSSNCRKMIHDAQTKRNDERVAVFRQVCDKFHPVLRYFFMEKFPNPDEWFEKRLAYTRSTAAISILGHVLGLGDRHGHNILLDDKTGEVVHIDLGIAFEQGRVLPVPELVPFRLTRDVVDGMGITKTDGVFRRCCEFTLDALRKESYTIMTILDVLRYDPLYNWSVSPLRLKKLQEDQMEQKELADVAEDLNAPDRSEKKDEEGEADRALTIVAKKLSKSLSVEATVNELIQQAMDERNLALLFAGWAAYA